MKKILLVIVLASYSFGTLAQPTNSLSPVNVENTSGGFYGPKDGLSDVREAKKLRDDTWVVLEGNIAKRIGDELYEFYDRSGRMAIELDDKYWQGLRSISPSDKVRLEGVIDRDWNNLELDVKSARILR